MNYKEINNFNFTPFPNKIQNNNLDEYKTSFNKNFNSRYNFNYKNNLNSNNNDNNLNKYLLIKGINKNDFFNIYSHLNKIENFDKFFNNIEKNVIIIKYKTIHSIKLALDYLQNLNKKNNEILYQIISSNELNLYISKINDIKFKNNFLYNYDNISDEINDKYYFQNDKKTNFSKFLDIFFNY